MILPRLGRSFDFVSVSQFVCRRQARNVAARIVEEITIVGGGDRKPVTSSVHSRDVLSQNANEALKQSACSGGGTKVASDVAQGKGVNGADDLKLNEKASKTSHGDSSSLSKAAESLGSRKRDSSVATDDVTSSVDPSSHSKPTEGETKETQPPKSDKKTEIHPKPKPTSWAALFVNTPPHASAPRGKTGQLIVPPHSVNYPSGKASSTDFVDISAEPEVVSVDEDPRAASLAGGFYGVHYSIALSLSLAHV